MEGRDGETENAWLTFQFADAPHDVVDFCDGHLFFSG